MSNKMAKLCKQNLEASKITQKWRFTTTEKRLEFLRKEKKEKKEKKALSSSLKRARKAFPVDHAFLSSVVSQKAILFHLRSQNLWFIGKNFPQDGL